MKLLLLAAALACAAETPVKNLASAPAKYYDKPLCVRGRAADVRRISAPDGSYDVFTIRSGAAEIEAVAPSAEAATGGIIACGVFKSALLVGPLRLDDVLVAGSITKLAETAAGKPGAKRKHKKRGRKP
ncbi:MAG: hypothetical protein WC421_04810 [Elusimicrobiales bacterium]